MGSEASAVSIDPAAAVDPRAWELISSLLLDTQGRVNRYDVYGELHALGDDFLTPNGTHIVIGYTALANYDARSEVPEKQRAWGQSKDPAFQSR